MYNDSIKLIEMPEHNSISVCVYNEHDAIFELGERIQKKFEAAYMNGYNWDALITYYVNLLDPKLMSLIESDPEAGMFAAYMPYSEANREKMRRFESYIKTMVSDENMLMQFITDHYEKIEWD